MFLPSFIGFFSMTALPPSVSKKAFITSTPIEACAFCLPRRRKILLPGNR